MFDGIRFIIAGFSGRYTENPEGRKLIWAHMVVAFFALISAVFIAYVSFTRYKDLVSTLLPYPDLVAWAFTGATALFILTASSYVALYLIQIWVLDKDQSDLNWKGAAIFLVSGVLVVVVDFRMGMDGAANLSEKAAGIVAPVDESLITSRYDDQVSPLEDDREQILKKYTWRGVTHFQPTKYRPKAEYDVDKGRYDELGRQIDELRAEKNKALQDARTKYRRDLNKRDEKEALTFARLSVAVRYIYVIQFILCLVGAYISTVLGAELEPGGLIRKGKFSRKSKPRARVQASPRATGSTSRTFPFTRIPKSPHKTQSPPVNPGQTWEDRARANGASEQNLAFLQKYPGVVSGILGGESVKEAATANACSESTVKNVKRAMRQANLID